MSPSASFFLRNWNGYYFMYASWFA